MIPPAGAPQILELRPDQIEIGDRLRPVDRDHVAFIRQSIEAMGQLQEVVVRPPAEGAGAFRLVAGAHRVVACGDLGRPVRARVEPISDDQARMLEVDENLARHDLTELDRSFFLVRRKELWERLYPEAKKGGNRRGSDQTDKVDRLVPAFADHLSAKLGLDARTVRRAIARYRHLAPSLRTRLAGTPIARKKAELDRLVTLPYPQQEAVVDRILGTEGDPETGDGRVEPDCRTVGMALRKLGLQRAGKKTDEAPADAALRRFKVLWESVPAARAGILQHLADVGAKLPARSRGVRA